MNDIFTEIKQDIARDKYIGLWKKYGKKIIILAVIFVAVFSSYLFYLSSQKKTILAASDRYIEFLESQSIAERQALLNKIYELDQGKIFSYFSGIKSESEASLERNYSEKEQYVFYSELLLLQNFISGKEEVEADKFKYLLSEFYLLKAFFLLEEEKLAEAKEYFARIISTPDANQNVRSLALEFISYLDENN